MHRVLKVIYFLIILGSKLLQKTNPVAFRNSVLMLGEFYHKARLANGQQLTFMATPFTTYLEMLLESAQLQDLKLFTAQVNRKLYISTNYNFNK